MFLNFPSTFKNIRVKKFPFKQRLAPNYFMFWTVKKEIPCSFGIFVTILNKVQRLLKIMAKSMCT